MEPEVIFHRLLQRDMNSARRFHTEETRLEVAVRFYYRFLEFVEKARMDTNRARK